MIKVLVSILLLTSAAFGQWNQNVKASVTTNSATITWTTCAPSSSSVKFGLTSSLGSTAGGSSNLVTSHLVIVPGLLPATKYHYYPVSKDSTGAGVSGGTDYTFTTAVVSTVSILISPTSATVVSNTTQQFTSTVTGTTNTAVTWSATAGVISTSGLFRAPSVTTNTSVSVTATSVADNTKSASAVVTVTLPGTTFTIGNTVVFPTTDSDNGNLLLAQKAVSTQVGTLQSLSFYVVNAAGKLGLGVYDASGPSGYPGKLLTTTNEITPVAGWNTSPVVSPIILSVATYWLAYFPSDNALSFKVDRSGAGMQRMFPMPYGLLPTTYPTNTQGSSSYWSFYATLSTSIVPLPPCPAPGVVVNNVCTCPPPNTSVNGVCTPPVTVQHTVVLNWNAPLMSLKRKGAPPPPLLTTGKKAKKVRRGKFTASVLTYNVYRSPTTGTGYAKINTSPISALTYTDGTVLSGNPYYYVVTTVDISQPAGGQESVYSNQAAVVIPIP